MELKAHLFACLLVCCLFVVCLFAVCLNSSLKAMKLDHVSQSETKIYNASEESFVVCLLVCWFANVIALTYVFLCVAII